jgi:hypothetical protein
LFFQPPEPSRRKRRQEEGSRREREREKGGKEREREREKIGGKEAFVCGDVTIISCSKTRNISAACMNVYFHILMLKQTIKEIEMS